ncbi:hypothetical protein GX51_02626 [Blastomyces parvus]|uniref:Uncharacterized protein n=1 Tax=Blastomyces parvus TaxID=2060905 RepID=A0A2B7XAM4_9EURO|nr:hypothetical protein GX51_02626 [Blastomyces parvus]
MAEAQGYDELPHRRVWLGSTEFRDDMEACVRGGLNDELRKKSNIRFAMEYYRQQPVQKWWASLGLLLCLLPTVLHVMWAFGSDTFFKSVQQGDIAAFAFIVPGVIFAHFNLWRQGLCLRVKIIHSVASLVGTVVNVALTAYLSTPSGSFGSNPRATISVLATALASLFVHVGSWQLLHEEVCGNLDRTEWADLLRLVWCSIPPENVAWQSLPNEERAWVQSKREEYLVCRWRELRSSR